MENKKTRANVSFAAIEPYIEKQIVEPTEKVLVGRDMVEWGERNAYPDYLMDLYKNVATLQSIINGCVDFAAGDDMIFQQIPGTNYEDGVVDTAGGTAQDLVRNLLRDYFTFGGFAIQVIRGLGGAPVEYRYLDMRFIRSNKDNSVFYYSEEWKKSRKKVDIYPRYEKISTERWATLTPDERGRVSSSIVFVKSADFQVYPLPVYGAAVKACEIERAIDNFHLNSINNGFVSSMIVNFNNGTPTDEMKKEIEKGFNEKFTGHQNAGRVMFSWNTDRTNATTITEPKVENFADRYNALADRCRQEIFTAFRANPNLFGIPTENLGFSQEEYDSAFKLFNRVVIRPVQTILCDTFARLQAPGTLTITPFSLNDTTENRVQ